MSRPWLRFALAVCAAPFGAPLPAADCDGLARLSLPATTLTTAQWVTATSFTPPEGRPMEKLPAFCRVAGSIRPSRDSDIQFEVWMPATGWNGKFQGIGNGGFAGSISYGGLADAIRHGYAAASTDTGHRAGGQDARWALGHPEKIIDFGHRAIHETAVQGKAIVQAFYGAAPKRSYFVACSNGGRQALMEAQRYPEDYDGIIAGAPANYWIQLMLNAASNLQATAGAAYIPASKLPAIQAAAIRACDAADGLADQMIGRPDVCRPDPASLLCPGAETDHCLTGPQVKALTKLYDGLRDAKGRLLVPGYSHGGEAEPGGWGTWITGKTHETSFLFAFATGFFRNMVYNDPNWDFRRFNTGRDWAAARKLEPVLNATSPDLSRFRARGGKLILYHGWCDAAIPAQHAIDYYTSVVRKLGAKAADTFMRLYMVPAMQHCGGGAGPNAFGQGGVARGDARTNLPAALERWVEQGVAPNEIIAARAPSSAGAPAMTRPLCPYPQVARFKGWGNPDDAANWECVAAPARS